MSDINAVVASKMEALTEQYRTITRNLAHASTSGYKRQVTDFANALAAAQTAGESSSGSAMVQGSTSTDFTQGQLVHTGRNLDLGLDGKGFFVVDTPQGELYTRAGVFNLSPQGTLVDYAGRPVAGEQGPITLPRNISTSRLTVAMDGTVSAEGRKLGKLKIVQFAKSSQLEEAGECSYKASPNAEKVDSSGNRVRQEYQEASNVVPIQEMVQLIQVSRLYEASAKSITTQDERSRALLRVATS